MLKKIKEKFVSMPSVVKATAAGSALMVASVSANADTITAINDAFTGATTNVQAVAAGVITLAAIVTGVGLIIRFLSK